MSNTAEIRQLLEEGYEFHGAYSRSHTEIKERAAQLRKEGNKARAVYVPDSKYSRGYCGGGGWSVYWKESEANKNARIERSRHNRIYLLERELERLEERRKEIEAEIATIKGEN